MSDVTQLPITFPNRDQHPSVRVNDGDTCVEPSEFTMSKGRTTVLFALAEHGACTDFELADHTGLQQTSAGKRRLELERAGLVVSTTERRVTPSGAMATVNRLTDQGIEYARNLRENP